MELLLNICWLLLTAPALFCWLRHRRLSRKRCSLIALACLLVLLFPVISVSDDLHAMRQEIEDSSTNKRTLKQSGNDKASAQSPFSNPPAQLISAIFLAPSVEVRWLIGDLCDLMRVSGPPRSNPGRAPPSLLSL